MRLQAKSDVAQSSATDEMITDQVMTEADVDREATGDTEGNVEMETEGQGAAL